MKTFDDYLAPSTAPKDIQPCDPFSVWMEEAGKRDERHKNNQPYAGEFNRAGWDYNSSDWEASQKYYEAEREINRAINSGAGTTNFGRRCKR